MLNQAGAADPRHILTPVSEHGCADWKSSMLTTAYREGLTTKLQQELACCDEILNLDQIIAITIEMT